MPATTERTCVACRRGIDASARICPFCGADPETGTRMDVRPIIESHFPPPPEISPLERVANFFRTRQMMSLAFLVLVGVGLLFAAHQWIQRRNRVAVAPTPGVTLTEVADLSRQLEERTEAPVPELEFPWEGDAKRMQTFVLEPGAIAPPPEPEVPEGGTPAASPAAVSPSTASSPGRPAAGPGTATAAPATGAPVAKAPPPTQPRP